METLFILYCIVIGLFFFKRAMKAKAKERKEAELLERNPEAWKVLKETQAQEKEQQRRQWGGAAVGIAKILLKKK